MLAQGGIAVSSSSRECLCISVHYLAGFRVVCAEQNTVGIPVAEMKDEYSKETLALGQQIQEYASMDPYSSERPKVVQVRVQSI